jgi:hypothetical protein
VELIAADRAIASAVRVHAQPPRFVGACPPTIAARRRPAHRRARDPRSGETSRRRDDTSRRRDLRDHARCTTLIRTS